MKKLGVSRNRTWTSQSGSDSANHETTNTDFLVAGQFNRVARDRLEHQRLQSNQLNGSAAVADRDLSHRFRERASTAFHRLQKNHFPEETNVVTAAASIRSLESCKILLMLKHIIYRWAYPGIFTFHLVFSTNTIPLVIDNMNADVGVRALGLWCLKHRASSCTKTSAQKLN